MVVLYAVIAIFGGQAYVLDHDLTLDDCRQQVQAISGYGPVLVCEVQP